MTTLTVGPGEEFSTIQDAVNASHNGDTVQIKAGTYTNNFATIPDSITLEAVGGMANLVETESPTNGKGMLTVGTSNTAPNVTINGLKISGVQVGDGNGAAIRWQSGNLTLNDDLFQNNQDGILGSPFVAGAGNLTINNSDIGSNGAGDGQSHNVYVGQVNSLTVKDSYIHDASVGNEIQSRAANNTIEGNSIFDNNSTASYSISLPNGGSDFVSGNIIEKGLNSQNPNTISFMQAQGSGQPSLASDNGHWSGSDLTVSGNTFVNDKPGATAVWNADTVPAPVTISDNSFWNMPNILSGPGTVSGSVTPATRPVLDVAHNLS